MLIFSNMSLPESPNVVPLQGELDLNVSAEVAFSLNELTSSKAPRVIDKMLGKDFEAKLV